MPDTVAISGSKEGTAPENLARLGDFTATARLLPLGALSACVALALLKLIGLFTDLVYFRRLATDLTLRFRNRRAVGASPGPALVQIMQGKPVTALPDEPLRSVVYRMAETGFTRLSVGTPGVPQRLVGMIPPTDLLKARVQHLEIEQRREQVLPLPFVPADVGTTRRYLASTEKAPSS